MSDMITSALSLYLHQKMLLKRLNCLRFMISGDHHHLIIHDEDVMILKAFIVKSDADDLSASGQLLSSDVNTEQ
ncbi:hypothetical protein AJ79_10353 [Helicocarpus griseus UAMH5409]|uniref:Uncharacterized protein n=1 Tax=Helicocarpus griseus UAMH5409 TaxID=1447875 RepID=A0A2B7WEB2_9EURO|nr:hypothetical protein AJ79_10353 [Helicocarpus griseus UAMH5409]